MSETVRIPIIARMSKNTATGNYELIPEKSVFADIPVDAVARFIMEGLHISFEEEAVK